MRIVSKPYAEESVHHQNVMVYFLFPQANLQLNIGHGVNVVFLASTRPKARATPNKACSLTQKYLAMKILFLS